MNETFKFLKENTQVNFVSTIDGNKPSCRPFGDPIIFKFYKFVKMFYNNVVR